MSGCSPIRERLTAWLDQETSAVENREIEAHLDSCPDCSAEARVLRRAIAWQKRELAVALLDAPVDIDALRAGMRRQILALRTAEKRSRRRRLFRPVALAVAAAVLLILWSAPQSEPLLVSIGIEPPPAEVARRTDKYRYLEVIENLELLEHLDALQTLPAEDDRAEAGRLWRG